MATQWFVRHDGKTSGPYSSSQLQAAAHSGQLKPDSLVRSDQNPWIRAAEVDGLTFAPTLPVAVDGQVVLLIRRHLHHSQPIHNHRPLWIRQYRLR